MQSGQGCPIRGTRKAASGTKKLAACCLPGAVRRLTFVFQTVSTVVPGVRTGASDSRGIVTFLLQLPAGKVLIRSSEDEVRPSLLEFAPQTA